MSIDGNKICFVIMPIADVPSYDNGHFGRVYDYIIKPAIIKAGFIPLRADEVQKTNYIIIDILQHIINSDMCVCDLSSRNPNVLYELGIRQAFNLPVTLIKDKITPRMFDIQGLRDVDYEESLRIDSVESAIEKLAGTIKNTYANTNDDVNSIIQLLGISPAQITAQTKLSSETSILLKAIENVNQRVSDMQNSSLEKVTEIFQVQDDNILVDFYVSKGNIKTSVGDLIKHNKFGMGKILKLTPTGKAFIEFENYGIKRIMLDFAIFEKIKGDDMA